MGGLKLADLQTRIHATHLSWIKNIVSHPDSLSARIITELTNNGDIYTNLLAKNTKLTKFKHKFNHLSDILQTWERFHNSLPSDEDAIKEEFLWNKKFITVENKTIWWKHWSNAGINFVNNLTHPNFPRFLPHSEISDRYHVPCTFLQALQIRSALPGAWRALLAHPAKPFFLPKLLLSPPPKGKHRIS